MSRRVVGLAVVSDQRWEPPVLEKVEPKYETQTLRKAQETLAALQLLGAVPWCDLARPLRRQAPHMAAIILTAFATSAAFAQPDVIRCLPPEVPVTNLPEAVLSEYRAEIAAEFEAYFAAVSTHIACLDTERSRTLAEAQMATEAYSTVLNIPPAKKDFP